MIEVIPCGTIVATTIGGIRGMITAVCIRFEAIQYEFHYFAGEEEKSIWITEKQFEVEDSEAKKIGFRYGSSGV